MRILWMSVAESSTVQGRRGRSGGEATYEQSKFDLKRFRIRSSFAPSRFSNPTSLVAPRRCPWWRATGCAGGDGGGRGLALVDEGGAGSGAAGARALLAAWLWALLLRPPPRAPLTLLATHRRLAPLLPRAHALPIHHLVSTTRRALSPVFRVAEEPEMRLCSLRDIVISPYEG
ncbi:unnamed protein product, partial [Iphiclides podalirius]